MLAGILKSDVAVTASLKIVDTFIAMKKYVSSNLIEQKYYNDMVVKHDSEIKLLQQSLNELQNNKTLNEIYFNGQIYDAYSKIVDILKSASKEVIIIDGYADKITLDIISKIKVKVILIVKVKTLLTTLDIKKYQAQYNNLEIKYSDDFHDRYFIIDKVNIYHCGSSINHAGSKTFSINLLEDKVVKNNLLEYILRILKK